MRVRYAMTGSAVGASAAVLGLLLLGAGASNAEQASGASAHEDAKPANESPTGSLSGWLEYAAATYQSDVAGKLTAPREAVTTADVSETHGLMDRLRKAADASMAYIAYWIGQVSRVAGIAPAELPYASVALLADEAARDARAFVEARRKAEIEWHDALEKADAAAAGSVDSKSEPPTKDDEAAAEAERKRAEARKEELRKIKEDLDRRIEEGLKKLEELEKLDKTSKTEATRKAIAADAANVGSSVLTALAERKSRAEADRKVANEKHVADAKAQTEAEQARQDEAARKAAAEAAKEKAAREKAAAEARQAEIRAAEARRQAEAERIKKEEERIKAAQAKKAAELAEKAAAEAEAAKKAAAEARAKTEREMAEARDAYNRSMAAASNAATSNVTPAQPTEEERKAEIRHAQERRVQAAKSEYARQVATAEDSNKSITDQSTGAKAGAEVSEHPEADLPLRKPDAAAKKTQDKQIVAEVVASKSEVRSSRKKLKAKSHKRMKAQKKRREIARAWKRKRHTLVERGRRNVYVVKRGDTLWSISRRYLGKGRRYPVIARANRGRISNPNLIYPGQRLRIRR